MTSRRSQPGQSGQSEGGYIGNTKSEGVVSGGGVGSIGGVRVGDAMVVTVLVFVMVGVLLVLVAYAVMCTSSIY